MAYEYIDNLTDLTGNSGSATYQTLTWDKILEDLDNGGTGWQRINVTRDHMVDGTWNQFFNGLTDTTEHTITTSWGVTIKYNPNNNPGCIVSWTENGNTYSQGNQTGNISKYGIRFAINRTTQEAVFLILRAEYSSIFQTPNNTAVYNGSYEKSQNNRQSLYRMLMGGIPPVYTWSSISAISGKNGILSLSILNDINDGNPVTTSDTNKFNLSKTSNLSTLINNAINS